MSPRPPILQLKKTLQNSVETNEKTDSHWRIRPFEGRHDVDAWLAIQNAAFQRQRPIPWTVAQFRRELADRPWWCAERLWFAVPASGPPVGSLALELNEDHGRLHWLAVLGSAQRRGAARCLVRVAERHCLQHGVFVLKAETANGSDAEHFYRRLGFKIE